MKSKNNNKLFVFKLKKTGSIQAWTLVTENSGSDQSEGMVKNITEPTLPKRQLPNNFTPQKIG